MKAEAILVWLLLSIEPDEKRLVLSKPAVHFSFTYGMLRGLLYNYLSLINSLFIAIYIMLWVFLQRTFKLQNNSIKIIADTAFILSNIQKYNVFNAIILCF